MKATRLSEQGIGEVYAVECHCNAMRRGMLCEDVSSFMRVMWEKRPWVRFRLPQLREASNQESRPE